MSEMITLTELDMKLEQYTEDHVVRIFPDSLVNENDMIYIRRTGGRIQWLKAKAFGGEHWQELTPLLVEHGRVGVGVSPEVVVEVEVDTREIGWYQDIKGDLYQYSGSEWVGKVPTKKQIEELEYLG